MIFDEIYNSLGREKLEKFLDAVKIKVVGSTLEFHLDCFNGHMQMSLDMTTPRSTEDVNEIYSTLWKSYTFKGING